MDVGRYHTDDSCDREGVCANGRSSYSLETFGIDIVKLLNSAIVSLYRNHPALTATYGIIYSHVATFRYVSNTL